MDVSDLAAHADLISLSAHKVYGPQGIGALCIRRDLKESIEPMIYGGGQQEGLRSGTVPMPLCVGIGAAAEIVASGEAKEERKRVAGLAGYVHSTCWKEGSSRSLSTDRSANGVILVMPTSRFVRLRCAGYPWRPSAASCGIHRRSLYHWHSRTIARAQGARLVGRAERGLHPLQLWPFYLCYEEIESAAQASPRRLLPPVSSETAIP